MSGKRSSGGPPPHDLALWDEVTKSVKPLRKRRALAAKLTISPDAPSAPPVSGNFRTAGQVASATLAREAPKPPPLAKLDRRAKSRVARGRVEIDARLDLHGMTLERARTRLARFLTEAQSSGHALVLVITGKGVSGRGALKHEVPHWLSLPELRPLVIGFEEAAPNHGGAGALYVRIRRRRD
jgi:DNA-nicking Smr family endonuclease